LIEYGFKQVKDELGWGLSTTSEEIEKWWEIVCSACLMVSLQSNLLNRQINKSVLPQGPEVKFSQHQWWDKSYGWKTSK